MAAIDNVFDSVAAAPEVLAERMVDAIWAEIPAYTRAESPRLRDDVYDQCLHHAKLLPEVLGADRTPTRDELAFAREAACRRAGGGFALDAFLHAFRVAHGVMWEAISESADAREALPLAGRLIEYFDVVSTQVAEAYVREEQRVHAVADRERRDLVESLLVGRLPESEGPHRAAPGIDPTAQLMVVVTQADDVGALQHAADALATTTQGHVGAPLVVVRQAEVVALVAAKDGVSDSLEAARALLRKRQSVDLRAGVSSALPGFAGVRRGYREAEHAVRQATADRPVIAVADIPAFDYLLISADAATRAVVAAKGAALAALRPSERGVLEETIAAYVEENLNVARTAQRLGVHPNTLRYRLERITERVGHDPRRLTDTIDLLCMLRLGVS